MPNAVPMGTMLQCSFGAAPSSLIVTPTNTSPISGVLPAAIINDKNPIASIPPFGVCSSLANPQVAAATAAALGVLTPQPCIPNLVAPWVPGSVTAIAGVFPILNNTSKLMCMWAGVIQISGPGDPMFQLPA